VAIAKWNKRSRVQEGVEFGGRVAADERHRRELDVSPEMPPNLLTPVKTG
jgi:hypothetical protein